MVTIMIKGYMEKIQNLIDQVDECLSKCEYIYRNLNKPCIPKDISDIYKKAIPKVIERLYENKGNLKIDLRTCRKILVEQRTVNNDLINLIKNNNNALKQDEKKYSELLEVLIFIETAIKNNDK